jgi:hypothetical protein
MYKFIISRRKGKKYDVYKDGKYLVSFGSLGYQQFKDKTPLKSYSHLDHGDKNRRKRYYQRHGRDAKFESTKWFSHKYLW